mgnify:FL=1
MKTRLLLLSVLIGAMPLTMTAQDDDLYFTPKKSAKTDVSERFNRDSNECPAYYCGSNRNVDEYNRRGKLKSYYQKIGTDSLGNDIIEFHEGDGTYGKADLDSNITIYPGSERYYDDEDSDFAYSRRMGRFDGFYGYWDPAFYGTYWGSPYWRSYYSWYDPWYDPWYGPYYAGWYGPHWHYGWGAHYGWGGYYGWGWPYYGCGGWYGPRYYAYSGPTGTRNHANGGGRFFGKRDSNNNDNRNRSFGNRNNTNNSSRWNDNNRSAFGNRRNNSQYDNNRYQQQSQRPSYNNSNNNGFGSNRGSFGGGSGFGSNRGSFGGGGGSFGGGGSRGGGFGNRR